MHTPEIKELLDALEAMGWPVSPAAEKALNEGGSMEARRLNAAVKAVRDCNTVDRLKGQMDYAIDLQRIIEDLCADREIRLPGTSARYHYDMAVRYGNR